MKIKYDDIGTYYLNEENEYYRLDGPTVINYNMEYWINDIEYGEYMPKYNEFIIYYDILKLIPEYQVYIKQNIKELIKEYNPKIELYCFNKYQINQLPNWLKDLIIL